MQQFQNVRPFLFVLAVAVITGCASSGSANSVPATRNSSPDYVTSIEVEKATASNAYELITRLRPRWLQTMPSGSFGGSVRSQIVAVYLDGIRMGDVSSLRSISTSGIKTMQYYDATRAATVIRDPGSAPVAGAIVITTNRVQ